MNNENLKYKNFITFLSWLTIAVSCIGINSWTEVPIGNFKTTCIVEYLYLMSLLFFVIREKSLLWTKDYISCTLFLIWAFINILRGLYIADNRYEYIQLITGIPMCSLPLFAFMYRFPNVDLYILRKWNKWMSILFLLFFVWVCGYGCYYFLLPFLLLYISFFKYIPPKEKVIIAVMAVAMCLDLTARSNIIKVLFSVMIAFVTYFRSLITNYIIRMIHWMIYGIALFCLIVGIMGKFNVFEDFSSSNEGRYIINKADKTDEDLAFDTRTFIYYEVINSAIQGNYVIFGNTPARGNFSPSFFLVQNARYENLNGKNERHYNELVHLNIFTWLGIIGVILYSFIYLRSSYMAVYHSNNFCLKLIGICIAFHWAYGWIEDLNSFTVQNMWIWMMIAMGLSSHFREMSDKQMVSWIKSIFN